MANGSAIATPPHPNGRKREPPSAAGSMFSASAQLKCGIAPIQNTARIASASAVTATENLKVVSTPIMLTPTNTA